ncbi:hypothetical protein ACLOJK_016338 [Asimina triloba]
MFVVCGSNDVYDFDTGADENKKESVVNILGSRTATLFAANVSLALGFIGLAWGSLEAGDISSISLLTGAILCGYVYQVRLGTDVGSDVVKVAVLTIYFLLVVFGIMKTLPMTCIDKAKIFMAKYYCVRLHALFGAALAAGLVAARTLSRVHLRCGRKTRTDQTSNLVHSPRSGDASFRWKDENKKKENIVPPVQSQSDITFVPLALPIDYPPFSFTRIINYRNFRSKAHHMEYELLQPINSSIGSSKY